MGKLKFTLSNILLYVALIATCLILEDVGFLSSNPTGPLSNAHFFMFFTLAMGCYLSYFLIEHIKNKVTLDYVLSSILLIAFAGGCFAIWQFSGVSLDGVKHYEYNVTNWDKVMQTLSLMVYLVSVYSILFYFNKNHPSIRKIKVVYFIIVIFCLLSTVYSWIRETDKIIYNLTASGRPADVKSLFWNPNMFSLMLLLGIFSCFGLNYYKKNVLSYISMFYLGFFVCVVVSLTAVAVMFASLSLYFLIEIIFTIRKRRARGLAFLTIYLFIMCSLVVLLACGLNYNLGGLSSFLRFLYLNFAQAHYDTLSLRTFTWSNSINYIGEHPMNLIFGFGFKNSNHVIGGFWNAYKGVSFTTLSAHSGYIQALMNFGILGVLFLFLFVVYYLYCFIRLIKKDARFAFIFVLMGFALFGYAVMESLMFLGTGTMGLLIAAFFYLPIMNKWKHYKYPRLGDDVIEVNKPKPMPSSSISKSLAKLFMALIAVTAAMFIFPLFRENRHGMYLLVNIIVLLFICALFVPFIISCIAKNHSRKAAAILSTVNFLIVASPVVYLALRYYFHRTWFASGAEWILPVMVILILVGEALIFGVGKRMKFRHYLSTLVGMSKNSFMGLVGVGIIVVCSYVAINYLDLVSPISYILYAAIALVAFYLASYLVPFKDQKAFINSYNESLLYSLKLEVLKDRLGDYNEKRRD
ncbi:MAG: O-antigen ligase family protein [Bacilli bacterium]|nr:O-antigen ligase family protein [Bacilli bacterium]